MRADHSRLLAAFLIVCTVQDAGAQPLAVNASAARSDISNPSSYNPAAAASDLRNPSAINPAAAASQLPPPSTGRDLGRTGRKSGRHLTAEEAATVSVLK